MVLPANISTGRVTGQFIVGVADGVDADDEPDVIPAIGTVVFTASVPYVPSPLSAPNPVTVLKTSIVGILDSEGYLCTPDPIDPTVPGARGVRLIATDDEDLSVTGWTWHVKYTFAKVNGATPSIPSHSFALPAGAAIDLTTVVQVPSSTGIGLEQAEALAASAQAAAQEASDALAEVQAAAVANDTGVATLLSSGVETSEALDVETAAKIRTPGTQIATELSATYASAFPESQVIVYNAQGGVESVTENGITTTYTYNPDGSVATDKRTIGGVTTTRNYVYTNGNLTRIEVL